MKHLKQSVFLFGLNVINVRVLRKALQKLYTFKKSFIFQNKTRVQRPICVKTEGCNQCNISIDYYYNEG